VDFAQAFILDAGWIFFAAWGMVLAAVCVAVFRGDIFGFKRRHPDRKNLP